MDIANGFWRIALQPDGVIGKRRVHGSRQITRLDIFYIRLVIDQVSFANKRIVARGSQPPGRDESDCNSPEFTPSSPAQYFNQFDSFYGPEIKFLFSTWKRPEPNLYSKQRLRDERRLLATRTLSCRHRPYQTINHKVFQKVYINKEYLLFGVTMSSMNVTMLD